MGWSSVLTVTSAAASQDLITLADFKVDHGITVTTWDTLLERMITRSSAAIARATGRVFAQETVSEVFRLQREVWDSPVIDGQGELLLSRWPVISITSVTEEADAALNASLYALSKTSGIMIRLNDEAEPKPILWPEGKITVVYVAGYAAIPKDLEEAASLLVWDRFQARALDRTVKSKYVDGVDRVEYFDSRSQNFPPEVQDIIDSYRVPVFK